MTGNNIDLIQAEEIQNPIEIFSNGGIESIVEKIESSARSIIFDIETPKGRKEVASTAHKISRSKTTLDAMGKQLVAEWKQKSKAVDSERKLMRDRLDSLRDEIRNPLTEWEENEERKKELKKLAEEIAQSHELAIAENELFDRKKEIERKEEEQRQIELKRIAEEEAAENERLRIEREKRIRIEAEERVKREAEEKAERAKEQAEQKIIQARLSEERAKQKEKEAEQRRINDLRDQELRIKKEQEQKEEENRRKEAAKKAEAERIASNKQHRKAVNNKILNALRDIGITEEQGKSLIMEIAKNKIPNLKIIY